MQCSSASLSARPPSAGSTVIFIFCIACARAPLARGLPVRVSPRTVAHNIHYIIEYTSVYIVYEHSTARRCAPLAFTRRGRWTQITGNSQSLSWPVDASDAGKTTTLTKQGDLFGGSRHALFAQEVERGFHVSIRLHTEAGGRCDQHQVHRENRTVARRMASSHTRDTRMKPGS